MSDGVGSEMITQHFVLDLQRLGGVLLKHGSNTASRVQRSTTRVAFGIFSRYRCSLV